MTKIRIRGAFWTHKKHGKRQFQGSYRFTTGEREFILVAPGSKSLKPRNISFESHQAAKAQGWVKA